MRVIIGADFVPTSHTEKLFIEGNTKELFGEVLSLSQGANRFMVNLECALTDCPTPIKKIGPALKASPQCIKTLKAIGITDAFLSNNHVFAYGEQGLRDTMRLLKENNIEYTGVGENEEDSRKIHLLEIEGKKLAFVNVCEHEYTYALPNRLGANPYDPYLTMHDIRKAKENADYVIVIYHGGKEHCRFPSPRLCRLAHEMAECGADVVLMQHSHCIGCFEEYCGCKILYGQGNFHFVKPNFANQLQPDLWNTSLLVELIIDDKLSINFYPLIANDKGIDLAKGEKAKEIMEGFENRNESLKNGTHINSWKEFCLSQTHYQNLISLLPKDENGEINELLPHYLDCEAHTDVLRELMPTYHKK